MPGERDARRGGSPWLSGRVQPGPNAGGHWVEHWEEHSRGRTEAEARGMSWLCEDVVRWVWAGGIQGRGGGAGKGEAAGKTG